MKFLIIDDSKVIYNMVSEMLEEKGHKAIWAENGKKAVEILQDDKYFDFLLLDWNMPEMDGMQFLFENRKENLTSAPILMMTTENKPEKMQEALSQGAVEYITKPFDSDILFQKIDIVMDDF